MRDLIRSEWIKVRSVRVNFVLAVIAAAFPIVIVTLVAALTKDVPQGIDDLVDLITGTMVVTALLLGVVGALNLTSEYSTNTIRVTFAAVPRRTSVLLAKLTVSVVTFTLFAAIIEAICFAVGSAIYNARDGDVIVEGTDKAAMLGLVVLVAMLILLAFALGLIIRNSPATITTFILWPILLENIVRGVLSAAGVDNQTPWLPYQSAVQMANPELDSGDPTRVRAGLFLGAIIVVLLIVGMAVNERRDA